MVLVLVVFVELREEDYGYDEHDNDDNICSEEEEKRRCTDKMLDVRQFSYACFFIFPFARVIGRYLCSITS